MEWCPTKEMVTEFMTKPLQGSVFRNVRDLIMGLLLMKEAAKVLTRDGVSKTGHEGFGIQEVAPQECVGLHERV